MPSGINWPPSLPQQPTVQGYGEVAGAHVLRSPMDAGPPKLRRVGARADVLTVGYQMTTAQVATLETFVKTTTAGGIKRFNWTHPRTGASREVRLVAAQGGDIVRTAYLGPNLWRVELQVEVLP